MIITSMTKRELAMLYAPELTPHAAVNRLMTWISRIPKLGRELEQTGYQKHCKLLSPDQVQLIFKYLGEP